MLVYHVEYYFTVEAGGGQRAEENVPYLPTYLCSTILSSPETNKNEYLHETMSSSTTSAGRQMFEGVGAPVNLNRIDARMDPTLDACCQREVRRFSSRFSMQ